MNQTALYAPVLAKIGAERSNLLSDTKLKTLSESKNLQEFTAQLRESRYQTQIGNLIMPLNSRKLERAFIENFVEAVFKIMKNSPPKASGYLQFFLLRFEVENLKTLMKATNSKLSTEAKLAKMYLTVEDHLKNRSLVEEAAKASTMRQAVNVFKNTDYFLALDMGLQSYEEDGLTACLDVLLDKTFYEKIYDIYMALPKKEKVHADFYASLANDGFALLTILRGKALKYDSDWLRLAAPKNNFNLTKEKVEAMVTSPDYESAMKLALESPYGAYFAKAQSPQETLVKAEEAFKKTVLQQAKASKIPESFNIGAALAYLTEKEAEVHNLVAIGVGVESQMKPEDIQRQLLF